MNGCQSKKFAVMLVASAFCCVASAVSYYHWNVVTTGGNLDDPANWQEKAVPTNDIDNVRVELYNRQDNPLTLQADMKTGSISVYGMHGGSGNPARFDLSPYTLTTKRVTGAYGLTFGGGNTSFAPSKIKLVSGNIVSPIIGFQNSNAAGGGGHYLAVDGDDATVSTAYFVFDYNNNRVEVNNGTVYGVVLTSTSSAKTNNLVSISGSNAKWITKADNGTMFTIGRGDSCNRMEILDGGAYSNLQTEVGFYVDYNGSGSGGGNNSIIVRNGTFSKPQGEINVGYNGSSNSMVVTEGALVNVSNMYVGRYSVTRSASSGDRTCENSLLVSDPGTVFSASHLCIGANVTERDWLVVTNCATLRTSGSLIVGGEKVVGCSAYFGPDVSLSVGGNLVSGNGGGSYGNSIVMDGTTFNKAGSSTTSIQVGNYGYGNTLTLQNGASFIATNKDTGCCYVGFMGGASNNTLRITSGATMRCSALEIGYSANAGRNTLELENGTFSTLKKPGSSISPWVCFDRNQTEKNSELVIKGTNSYFYCSYATLSKVRYEIPAEGLADTRKTNPVCNIGYMAGAPNAISIDVDGACPKGKWLLMKWNTDSTTSAETLISRTSLTGEGAGRASLEAGDHQIYLKVKGSGGMMLICR